MENKKSKNNIVVPKYTNYGFANEQQEYAGGKPRNNIKSKKNKNSELSEAKEDSQEEYSDLESITFYENRHQIKEKIKRLNLKISKLQYEVKGLILDYYSLKKIKYLRDKKAKKMIKNEKRKRMLD